VSRSIAARRLAACLLALGLLAALPTRAWAHAELVESNPAPNAALIEAPDALTITFSEPIDPETSVIELLDAQQQPIVGVGGLGLSRDGRTATLSLPELDPDVYTVSYQVVSRTDGHATAGFYAFLIDPSGAAPPPTDSASASSPSVDPFTVAARWFALAMMLVAFGSITMWWNAGSAAGPARPPWWPIAMASLGAAAGVVGYLLLAARPISGAPGTGIPLDPAAAFGWTPFAIAMRVAVLAGVLAAGMAVAGARFGRDRWLAVTVALVLAVGMAGMSLAGHAATGGVAFAAIDWLHLVAVAAWLGGLPAALVLAGAGTSWRASLAAILRRHGRVALVAAPVVALTGIANSPIVLGSGRDLVASDYGNLLVAKAGLLAVALGIGAVNHLALRGRGRAAVIGLVGAELAVAVLAVSAAATMVTIQPASQRQPELATTPVNPAHFFGELAGARVHVSVSVPAPGDQAYRALLTDPGTGGAPPDVQKVFLLLTPPSASDLPAERIELGLQEDPLGGLYAANGAFTPLEGDWGMEVIVRRQGLRDESLAFVLAVSSPGTPELGPPRDTGIGVPAPLAATWSILPGGPAGWLPVVIGLAGLAGAGWLRPSATRSMARGAFATLAVLAVLAAGSRSLVDAANAPSADVLAEQPPMSAPADLGRGEAVYRANCASCHGLDARGDGAVATQPEAGSLLDAARATSDAELSYRIAYGVAGTPMPSFAGLLTPDERADLIAYLRALARDD
jgi:copper transport protein